MESFFTPLPTAESTIEAFSGSVKGRVERLRKFRRFQRRPIPDGMLYKSAAGMLSSPASHSTAASFHPEKLIILPSCGYESSTVGGFGLSFLDVIDRAEDRRARYEKMSGGSLSPTYAGARFSDAPSPKVLPPPPRHWVTNGRPPAVCSEMTHYLKTILRVQ